MSAIAAGAAPRDRRCGVLRGTALAYPPTMISRTSSTGALGVVLAAQCMVVLDFSIVNVALPSIQRDLALSPAGADWIVTAYAVTFGGLLILGGRTGDLFGRRRLFLVGLLWFAAASLLGSVASSGAVLIAARGMQGVGAAMVAPTALALITTTFAEGHERHRALGLYGATASVGFVAGLVLGGVLVSIVGWRSVLWVNVPIGLATAFVGWRRLPHDVPDGGNRLDVGGGLLVTALMATLVYLPSTIVNEHADSRRVALVVLTAVVMLVAFVAWERRQPEPLVRFRLFRLRTLTAANVVTLLFGAWNGGQVLIFALYLQQVLGYEPLWAGIASAPQGLAGLTAGLVGARLADRLGIKPVLIGTTVCAVVGHLMLARASAHGDYASIGIALVPIGLGNGGTALAATVIASTGVDDDEQGLVGGLINSFRQLGSGLGVAVLTAIAISVAAAHHGPPDAALAAGYHAAFVAAAGFAAVALLVTVAFVPSRTRAAERHVPRAPLPQICATPPSTKSSMP
jgi:EmrB/QacA subfamily drug resistance transporter